jgi:5-methylthioadenosine/S-adenosylhomocysteine deaminase
LIEDKYIKSITTKMPNNFEADKIIDGKNKIAFPGMVNTHTHAAMTLLRSYADDMVLMDWLEKKIWPAEANLTADDIYYGTKLAIIEMIKTGTTTFADMYFEMDHVAKAVSETGIRASLSRGLIGLTPDADEKLEENATLYKDWHNSCDGRIQVRFGPHAPYTCPVGYLKKVIKTAQQLDAGIHMHLSETAFEVDTTIKEHGMTPIALMDSLGMFESSTLAAHAVHVTNEDIDIMANKNVCVAHNPQSNLKLASGIAPVEKMLAKGILVGLGTDGASSNNNLNMLEEVRLAAMLHKNKLGDPLIIPATEALKMGTVYGAKALGFEKLGELVPGNLADIVLYDMNNSTWFPRHDRTSLFVYSANATEADTVLINGRVVMENKNLLTIDEEAIYYEANNRGLKLIEKH